MAGLVVAATVMFGNHAAAQGTPASGAPPSAAGWPNRPIRWVVPYGPGSTDILARILAQRVGTVLGQQVLVENRPGAGGGVGTEQVARSAPDGYTLLLGAAATHAVNPALFPKLGYDAQRDFAPVVLLASIPNVLIVNPALGLNSVADLIARARSQTGQLLYSSNGPGTSPHMSASLFELLTGTRLSHVPYKGSAEAVVAVARGDVQLMFANLAPALPMIRDGRVKPLAVTVAQRLPGHAEWPTVAEAGVPGFEVSTWFALFAPAGTPEAIMQRLNREFAAALSEPDTRDKLLAQGFVLHGGSPGELAQLVSNELTKWARVVRASGARSD
jgi:tripartite-type tricarboxylate transporter receptor subunit TctC